MQRLLPDGAAAAADEFQPDRALQRIQALWSIARRMDLRATDGAADFVAESLREAGLTDARVERLPADGVAAPGGWRLPVAWTVELARLEVAARSGPGACLADYAENPQTLAMYSPGTPHDGWVEGPVVVAEDVTSVRRRLRGAFLFVKGTMPNQNQNAQAAQAGALAIVTCVPNASPAAARYLNYAVPLDAQRPCIPCFSLPPEQGARLDRLLLRDARLRLRAQVLARRTTGTFPLVTATLGEGDPVVYLCAHLDEIGAQDNASGVGVAIEAVRALAAIAGRPRFPAPRRALRVFFSVEVRGMQAWLNQLGRAPAFLAGLNLDMVGREPRGDAERFILGRGFPGQTHFAHRLLGAAACVADARAGRMERLEKRCVVSDAFFGLNPAPGHVSIEQGVGPAYHTSADVPSDLSPRAIQWAGTAATAFLYAATRFGSRDALRMARQVVSEVRQRGARPAAEAAAATANARALMDSLRQAMGRAELFGPWTTASDYYRAGVTRATGLWPAVADAQRLEAIAAGLPAMPKNTASHAVSPSARRKADAMVPAVSFRGFLSFEDQVSERERAALHEALGLKPDWGTESWAWTLAAQLRGKRTLAEVVDDLREAGVSIEMDRAIALAEYLVRIGKARLRPVLGAPEFRRALRAVGVRPGSILCMHASLSQFGYVPGGAATLVDAVLDLLGPRGTLCMPAHSLSVLGNTPYDPAVSPGCVGAVSEHLRRRRGARRSPHPTHSVVALGPAARALTSLPRIDTAPLARDGFWGKLVDAGGDVLLLCPVNSATIFHVGEAWTGVPQPPLVVHARNGAGRRRVFRIPQAPWHADHFRTTMAEPLLSRGEMRSVALGESAIYWAPARAMADISVAVNRADPLVSLVRKGACGCFYCQSVDAGVARAKRQHPHARPPERRHP
jgi:aminoglycoside 3-N-acetyltransferase